MSRHGEDRRVRDAEAAAILSNLLGRKVTTMTLRNWRYQRRGPEVEYLGPSPRYQVGKLHKFAREEAYRPQPRERRAYRPRQREETASAS